VSAVVPYLKYVSAPNVTQSYPAREMLGVVGYEEKFPSGAPKVRTPLVVAYTF
jgi:hypothetical protein